MRRVRSHLTYANVISTLCLFVLLGGGAYAAFHLPKNSVRSKNIVNGQVKARDLAALRFKRAGLPDSPCGVNNGWVNQQPAATNRASYARDGFGVVHLRGLVKYCGTPSPGSTIFTLPRGYRPARDEFLGGDTGGLKDVLVHPSGDVNTGDGGPSSADLDGFTFRCGPSGKNGCP